MAHVIQPPMSRPLVAHVATSTGLTEGEATRLVSDVIAYFHEPVEDVVRQRHAALRSTGLHNEQAFEQIAAELEHRVVAAPRLSVRQLRRLIYG